MMDDKPDFSKFVNWSPPGWGVSEGVHIGYEPKPMEHTMTDWSGAVLHEMSVVPGVERDSAGNPIDLPYPWLPLMAPERDSK